MVIAKDKRRIKVVLSLGSNLGDRKLYLKEAKTQINKRIGSIQNESAIYETESWGKTDLNSFLNQVVLIETSLTASIVLNNCLKIEKELGRKQLTKDKQLGNYENRCIDIDVLYYGSYLINSEQLTLPHPQLHLRKFVLLPLNEIAPNWVHPVFNESTEQLLKKCCDENEVKFFTN